MRRCVGLVAIVVLLAGASLAFSRTQSELGPIPSMTNAPEIAGEPPEQICIVCHFDDPARDPLNTPGGGVEILGVPRGYEPGRIYPLTIRLHTDSTATRLERKWGFQLTAVRADNGQGAGTFVLNDPDTLQIIVGEASFASRRYVEHTWYGTRCGLASPVTWTLCWQAPDSSLGKIYFFAAGNAADGTWDPAYDYIFTTADSTVDLTSPVVRTTWGEVKARWR
jgi:hypothetical protein